MGFERSRILDLNKSCSRLRKGCSVRKDVALALWDTLWHIYKSLTEGL